MVRIDGITVATGGLGMPKTAGTETSAHATFHDLDAAPVEVTRVRVDREVDEAPRVRQEGDVTIISLVEEVLVVTKRLFLREEIHVRRSASARPAEPTVPSNPPMAGGTSGDQDLQPIEDKGETMP